MDSFLLLHNKTEREKGTEVETGKWKQKRNFELGMEEQSIEESKSPIPVYPRFRIHLGICLLPSLYKGHIFTCFFIVWFFSGQYSPLLLLFIFSFIAMKVSVTFQYSLSLSLTHVSHGLKM